ncbi:MAG: hypothetical protein GY697_26360 [Desulfobacterales bacterium]|nr:hypothetical protein [Desulfobacterales bacterium]
MKLKWLIILLPALLLWSGCQTLPNRSVPEKLVPFTAEHMADFSEYLEEIQFYIGRQIVLHRIIESETKDVTGTIHTIQVEKDLQVKSITFPAKTPGVLFGIDAGILNIQFEPARDGRSRTIPFRPRGIAGGGDKPENTVFVFDKAEIVYDDSEYKVYYEEEDVAVTEEDNTIFAEKARSEQGQFITKKRWPILLINPVRQISRYKEENRVVPGVWE